MGEVEGRCNGGRRCDLNGSARNRRFHSTRTEWSRAAPGAKIVGNSS